MRWSRPEQAVVLLALVVAFAGSGALLALRRPRPPIRIIEPPPATTVVVQVDGEVERPGLLRLPAGSRVNDVIRAASGATSQADLDTLNLARVVHDGERITVPSRIIPRAQDPGGRMDLNTASTEDLEALPGVGPVLARRIIGYRTQHGSIQRLEDLLQVEGIGPRLLERLRPLVTIR